MPAHTAKSLEGWLIAWLAAAQRLDAQAIDPGEAFSRYGLDSLGATRLIAELSSLLETPLSPTLVWEHPSIAALAGRLTGETQRRETAARSPSAPSSDDPIAVVGMACRFPGAPDPGAFWLLLAGGVDAVVEVPPERWDAAALFHRDSTVAGKVNTRWGGFLDQVDDFDPQFFGISPREAVQMDPQQRLVLELAWEALEDAGIPPPQLAGSRTGVFVGALFTDHALLQDRAGPEAITAYTSTGGAACIIANRVSYALGLQGPSMTVDAACSSSLVAAHLACGSLRSGESDIALAGGVNLMLVPETTMGFSRLGAMSPDGKSRAFDARANGYVRSEGAGLVVLKRLSDALRDGDPVHAILRGSAVNNDGASNGLTAPSPQAQRAVLRDACASARLTPADIHYVEAHGTGTPLGDPIEASALGAVYGAAHPEDRPLLVGSAKTNVGHLEAAAGVVGLLKVVLAMKHDRLPPSLHFATPNPNIDFGALHLQVVTGLRSWPAPEGAPRRAGVSSFGYGGTNSHLIVESVPPPVPAPAARLRDAVWIFSGQGSQWPGMGKAPALSEPSFRAALARCDRALMPHLGWSVFEEILAGAPGALPDRLDVTWPVLFAFQVALAALLRSLGARPAAVMGHSIGEVTAAHVAGALTLDDAARVIACQARLVQRAVGSGSMLLAAVSWDEAQQLAASFDGRVTCAISASPGSTVLSGAPQALADLAASLAKRGVFVRPINTAAAVHGPAMAFLAEELPERLAGISPRQADVPLISTVTGLPCAGETLDAAYWARQLREPVLFAQGTRWLLDQGHRLFLEVSAHPIVKQSVEESIRDAGMPATVVASLVRGEGEARALRETLDALAAQGTAPPAGTSGEIHVLPLSGRVPAALHDAAAKLAPVVEDTGVSLDDLCYTAGARRAHHGARAAIVGRGRAELLDGLRALAERREHPAVRAGTAPVHGEVRVVFVFPGQGSQWLGMGRQLLAEEPAFRAALQACDAAVRAEAGFSIVDEIRSDEARLDRIDVVQPLLFAVEVALAALWRAWGVEPACVIGHSMGEVAAAHVAGILTLHDAARVICRRSRLLRRISGQGAMGLAELTLAEAEAAIEGHRDRLGVAVSNGPRSTVISGDPAALEEVLSALERRGVFCRRVKVDVASHSPQVDPLREDLLAELRDLRPGPARVPMRSTVTGELVTGPELTAAYWARNLRAPVLFSTATQRSMTGERTLFVELSPHPILLPAIEENLREAGHEGAALASLRRSAEERRSLLETLGDLHVRGAAVGWSALYPGGRCVALPSYPWQRERFRLDPGAGRARVRVEGEHPLLGAAFSPSLHEGERLWERSTSAGDPAFLADHRVQGAVVFPGAGYLEMAFATGAAVYGAQPFELREARFEHVLALLDGAARLVQAALVEQGPGRAEVSIASRTEGVWTRHARAEIHAGAASAAQAETPARIQARCSTVTESEAHYARMNALGLAYGPGFQGVERIWLGEGEALARVVVPEPLQGGAGAYRVHPTLLDACLQVAVTLASGHAGGRTLVPVSAARVRLFAPVPLRAWVHVRWARAGDDGALDLTLLDDAGVVAELSELRLAPLEAAETRAEDDLSSLAYTVAWRAKPLVPAARGRAGEGAWLVVLDAHGTGAALAERLRAQGETCITVHPARTEAPDRLFAETFGKHRPCRGVIHCGSLDARGEGLEADLRASLVVAVRLAQAMVRLGARDTPRLFLVTRGAQAAGDPAPVSVAQATLWGLGRTIALEHPELECTRIDLAPDPLPDEAEALAREILAGDGEDQIALRHDGRFAARLVRGGLTSTSSATERAVPAAGRPFQVRIHEPGVLDRLSLREMEPRAPGPGEVEIEVEAAGLNFLDVLLALGAVPDDAAGAGPGGPRLGLECAGRVTAVGPGVTGLAVGDEVMALAMSAMATRVIARHELVARKPERLSWEEAATVPIVFLTASYSLDRVGRLRRGERVLVHAGAGGVGLAAIQWAQRAGAEIFATAGSEEKRARLRALGVPHVMDSRSLSFVDDVWRATHGEGVDVVLNSLAGEFIPASLGLLRDHGRFVEIGKRDYYDNKPLGLRPFLRNLSFSLVDLRGMMQTRPGEVGGLLEELAALFASGALRPLPVEPFPASRAREAFDHMAKARHTGKVAIRMRDAEARVLARAPRRGITADGVYLITGGLGGLGLRLSRWLVAQGARHLVLVGRGEPSEEARREIRALTASGAAVETARGDVSRAADVAAILEGIAARGRPLQGVVHAAGVLDDRTLIELTEDQLWRPLRPKAMGAWNLHTATRALPLDFFVMYSSVTALLGSAGQANYAAGNAFLDGLAHARAAEGLPATSIQWGPFSEVGLAAAQDNRGRRMSHQGIESLTPEEGTALLARILERPPTEVGLVRMSLRRWLDSHPQAAGMRFLAELEGEDEAPRQAEAGGFRERLQRAAAAERAALITAEVVDHLARVLRMDAARIDRRAPFKSLGVDSLTSMELRNRLEAALGLKLSAALLFTYPSVTALGDYLLGVLAPAPPTAPEAPPPPAPAAKPPVAAPAADLAGMDADDLLALLDQELLAMKKPEGSK